jgi:hypothetical protein
LRKAPRATAPEGLLRRLQGQIRLPQGESPVEPRLNSRSWFRRWMPALSFGAFFIGCLVAIGVQTSILAELRRENEALRAATQDISELRTANQEYKRLLARSQELERLRKDNVDVQRLQREVAQLKSQLPELEKLKSQNQKLQAESLASAGKLNAGAKTEEDFFAAEQARAERINCVNNMKQIGLAARIWAGDHNDVCPTDFLSMTNELNSFAILKCPSDKGHSVTSWADVAAGNISYIMDAPGIKESEDPHAVFVECPIHHNFCMVDCSVQSLDEEGVKNHIKTVNGRKVFAP